MMNTKALPSHAEDNSPMRAANYSPFHNMADKYVLPSGGDLISVEISLFLHSIELRPNSADIDSTVICYTRLSFLVYE